MVRRSRLWWWWWKQGRGCLTRLYLLLPRPPAAAASLPSVAVTAAVAGRGPFGRDPNNREDGSVDRSILCVCVVMGWMGGDWVQSVPWVNRICRGVPAYICIIARIYAMRSRPGALSRSSADHTATSKVATARSTGPPRP